MTSPYAAEQPVSSNGYSAPHANGVYPASGTPTHQRPPHQSMDGRNGEYQQDQSAQYTPQQDVKFNQSAATPTNSDYSLNPSSARSGTFPEYIPRSYPDGSQRYHTAPNGMAQPTNPSIAQSSPTYPPQHYSPYPPPHHDMAGYHPQTPMYRPEYGAPYSAPPHMPYGHVSTAGGHPLSTVYSFVPIPGTHQQKRPRRRYEEIERMYKCGWNGCEKAYGTLNHLNAHVTMQGHGSKRTPEEFKEIRKEWKLRKKEEENQRKQDEERQRQQQQQQQQQQPGGADGHHNGNDANSQQQQQHTPATAYSQARGPQLPPLGYAPASGQVAPQYGQPPAGMDGMPQYPSGQMQSYGGGYPPHSPYGQTNQI